MFSLQLVTHSSLSFDHSKKFYKTVKQFFKQVIENISVAGRKDYYMGMLTYDVLCFLTIVFGYSYFSVSPTLYENNKERVGGGVFDGKCLVGKCLAGKWVGKTMVAALIFVLAPTTKRKPILQNRVYNIMLTDLIMGILRRQALIYFLFSKTFLKHLIM